MAKGKYEKWLEPENLILLEGWARDGLTLDDISHNMGINRKTLWEWSERFDPIRNALKNGKEVADFMVENALFKSALGYEVEEYEEKLDQMGNVVGTYKRRHITPNVTAQIFWLKNRKPQVWREKQEIRADVYENDGFLEAIKGEASELFTGGDDSEMVAKNE